MAKVFVQLEGVGQLPKDAVEAEFGDSSLQLTVRGYRKGSGTVLRLCVKRLAGEIVPADCKHRVLANKVVLTLAKRPRSTAALEPGAVEAEAAPAADPSPTPAADVETQLAEGDAVAKPSTPSTKPEYAPWSKLSAA